MKLRFALLVVAIPLLLLGGEGLYRVTQSRSQTTMTCAEFVRSRPQATWLRLTGCELDYASPGYRESSGQIAEIFFPVRVVGQVSGTPVPLLAATSDPQALAIVQGTIGNGREPDAESVTVMMLRVVTLLRASREIEGVARAGVIELLQTRRSLQSFPVALDPDYVVVDLHARPSAVVPAIETGLGLLAIVLFGLSGRARKAHVELAPPGEAPAPVQALPAMLLLNLGAAAGTDAIEGAPPLGTREDTMAMLKLACPGIGFNEAGSARLERPGVAIDIDIGERDPVWTATLRASGDGAVSVLDQIARDTGWRIYVPKRGVFLGAAEPQR